MKLRGRNVKLAGLEGKDQGKRSRRERQENKGARLRCGTSRAARKGRLPGPSKGQGSPLAFTPSQEARSAVDLHVRSKPMAGPQNHYFLLSVGHRLTTWKATTSTEQ